jgi:hypothetical protein
MDCKSFGNGSGTHRAYAIEIRTTYHDPQPWEGMIIDKEWRRVPIRLIRCDRPDHPSSLAQVNGIPVKNFNHEADNLNLMDFHAAYAAACTIHAQINNSSIFSSALCIETRLVEVEIKYSWSAEAKRYGKEFNVHELSRSHAWETPTVMANEG